jgi:hypothetical protein
LLEVESTPAPSVAGRIREIEKKKKNRFSRLEPAAFMLVA